MNKLPKKKLSFLLGLILLFLLKPKSVFAIFDLLLAPLTFLAKFLAACIALVGISYAFVFAANAFFGWATNPASIQLPVTNNPLVLTGWEVVRDFTNLFFILVVVALGLSVALRTISERQIGRLILKLIVVAVLINFTPVICGVLIDIANIFMNFFLTAAGAGYNRLINIAAQSGRILMGEAASFFGMLDQLRNGIFYFKLLFIVAFNFIAGFILFLIGGLFLLRNIVLWILVILAPLAFFMWILPQTQGFFKKWWDQFISWCFVGVGGAFFVFLAQVLFTQLDQILGRTSELIEGGTILTGPMAYLFTASAPLLLLVVGAQMVLSSAPQGAQIVTNLVAKGPQRFAKGAVGKFASYVGKEALRTKERMIPPKVQKIAEKLATRPQYQPPPLKQWKKLKGWQKVIKAPIVLPLAGATGVGTMVTRGVGKGLMKITGGPLAIKKGLEKGKKKMEEVIKKGGTIYSQADLIRSKRKTPSEMTGAISVLKPGVISKMIKEGLLEEEDITKIAQWAAQNKEFKEAKTALKTLEKAFVKDEGMLEKLAEAQAEAQGKTKEDWEKEEVYQKGFLDYQQKILSTLRKIEDIEEFSGELNQNLVRKIEQLGDPHLLRQWAIALGPEFYRYHQQFTSEEFGSLARIHPETGMPIGTRNIRYLYSTAARNLFGPPPVPEDAAKKFAEFSEEVSQLLRNAAIEAEKLKEEDRVEEAIEELTHIRDEIKKEYKQRRESLPENLRVYWDQQFWPEFERSVEEYLNNQREKLTETPSTPSVSPEVSPLRGPSTEEIPETPPEEERTSEDRLRGPGPEEIP